MATTYRINKLTELDEYNTQVDGVCDDATTILMRVVPSMMAASVKIGDLMLVADDGAVTFVCGAEHEHEATPRIEEASWPTNPVFEPRSAANDAVSSFGEAKPDDTTSPAPTEPEKTNN